MKKQSLKNEVEFPHHYIDEATGIESKHIAVDMPMFLGSAFKYCFRFQHKGTPLKDLMKAKECLIINNGRTMRHESQPFFRAIDLMNHIERPLMSEFLALIKYGSMGSEVALIQAIDNEIEKLTKNIK